MQILHVYYAFLSTLDYKLFLSNYLQLWQSYAVLIATTQRAFRPMVDILSIWRELGGRKWRASDVPYSCEMGTH